LGSSRARSLILNDLNRDGGMRSAQYQLGIWGPSQHLLVGRGKPSASVSKWPVAGPFGKTLASSQESSSWRTQRSSEVPVTSCCCLACVTSATAVRWLWRFMHKEKKIRIFLGAWRCQVLAHEVTGLAQCSETKILLFCHEPLPPAS
jgi:hypothetical protein